MIKNILPQTDLTLSDFYYDLPQEQIAQTPVTPRDASRLMVMDRRSGDVYKRQIVSSLCGTIMRQISPRKILW